MARLTPAMKAALAWLARGNEVSLNWIEGFGYSAEMPRRNTLQALADRGLAEVINGLGTCDVRISEAGRSALRPPNRP